MYKAPKQIAEELIDDYCFGCKFCGWNPEMRTEVCTVRGCYEGSKFVKYE